MLKYYINAIKRKVYDFLNINPGSEPFISGDTFRKYSTHILDKKVKFDPSNVKYNDVVFVQSDMLDIYFNTYHPHIQNKYILITHNSDENITNKYVQYIDDQIIIWYGRNVNIKHPKIIPLPIGLENLDYFNNGLISDYLKLQNNTNILETKILSAFSVSTNYTERSKALEAIEKNKFATIIKNKITQKEYQKLLVSHKFVLSPEGNGIDCHRTWEAIYANAIPIVKRSNFTEYFNDLPILILDDFNEINNYSQSDLDELYNQIMQEKKKDRAYFKFYKELIYDK